MVKCRLEATPVSHVCALSKTLQLRCHSLRRLLGCHDGMDPSAEFEHRPEKFTHSEERRLVGSSVVADMRPLLDARIGEIVRLPSLDVEDAAAFTLLERAIARRLIRREGLGHWDRRVVVCVMGIGELGELYVGTRLLQ